MGEVDFYIITLHEQERVKGKPEEPLVAEFIGSDYNYAGQPSFRKEFE